METTAETELIEPTTPAETFGPFVESGIGVIVDGHHLGHEHVRTIATMYLMDQGGDWAAAQNADVERVWLITNDAGEHLGISREPGSGRPVSIVRVSTEPSRGAGEDALPRVSTNDPTP